MSPAEPVRRTTKQQTAVAAALAASSDFISAQELHQLLRSRGDNVGLATVYRALQTMASDGTVDVLRAEDGESLYRQCETARHHHHLVCRSCGKAVEVEGAAVENWTNKVSAANGFRDIEHTVEIFGTCAAC